MVEPVEKQVRRRNFESWGAMNEVWGENRGGGAAAEGDGQGQLSRRTVTRAMAWSVPVVALTAATPLAAASTVCTTVISSTTAVYTRVSSLLSRFTWTNLFGDGKDLTLTFGATHTGDPNILIEHSANLLLDSAMHGGEALPSVRFALDTQNFANVAGGETVTFSFAYDSMPITVENLMFKIKDIDGKRADSPDLTGAERVSITGGGVGTIVNPAVLRGNGTGGDRWRLRQAYAEANDGLVDDSSTDGNVDVVYAATSQFTMDFVANNSGRSPGDDPTQNIWVGPFTFTVNNPACP